ncbi:hypothetical protein JYK22_20560, partial [Nonomuraea sp. RK-328]|nr:hypothetical protein [Nonomuraea sp. RK-328]
MSEVVPLPSFGEVFFDARGQERCLRVTWHEGTLVLSLWRGEMCTASFRMPMDDVGRLLDTLDDGFAEATGEQPAVPAQQDPGTEVIPGTGQYQRPQNLTPPPVPQQPEERPTATLSPSDVLVARGNPPRQDKLVASYSEPPAQRDPYGDSSPYADTSAGQYGDSSPYADTSAGQYGDSSPYADTSAGQYGDSSQYGERQPFTGPQYSDQAAGRAYSGQQYADPQRQEPFTGPQYVDDTPSGPQYSLDPDPFSGPHPVAGERRYQLPRERQAPPPHSTDPLGFPSQASDPFAGRGQDRHGQDHYAHDDLGHQQQGRGAAPAADPGTAGLGTPMHGIPGAGRRRSMPQRAAARRPEPEPYPQQEPYQSGDSYRVRDGYASLDQPSQARDYAGQDYPVYPPPANPVDPLLALGTPEQGQAYRQDDPLSRPYIGDPMFTTGERLRPDQQYDDRDDRREW